MVNWLVPKVQLKDDGSVDLTVEVGNIAPGEWAEISGYILQEDTIQKNTAQPNPVFAPFSSIQQIPAPAQPGGTPSVTVNVLGTNLNPAADVKVITRVAEVQAWPTRLGTAPSARAEPGVTTTWEAKPSQGAGPPGTVAPATMTVTGPGTPGQPNVTVTGLPNGARISITVEVTAEPGGTNT